MLTLSSEYALRSMIYLATHTDDWPVPGKQIAESIGVPRKYLGKILGDLVRAGVLEAARGKCGGFRLVRPARQISLLTVLTPFEPALANRRPCPFGNAVCSDADPCAGHDRWQKVRITFQQFLQDTSVQEVAVRRNGSARGGSRKRTL
ncbi:MAG: Rrf2 family transcriptional regulator [Planctomycetes bacterium]|nr:Rrf2 family transcriptional regulator [Planctomycetota bacterium]